MSSLIVSGRLEAFRCPRLELLNHMWRRFAGAHARLFR